MADFIAVSALSVQYLLIVALVELSFRIALPYGILVAVFATLAGVGIAVWHKKKVSQGLTWGRLALFSVVLGLASFGVDWLLASLQGQSNPLRANGGLFGLPLTLIICPFFTMICVAGLVRALYISRAGAR